jgi:FkbH-like protein
MSELIKCVVWDLDNTIWDGVLLEEEVRLKQGIKDILETMDQRGILQSVASRNNYDDAMGKLRELGIDHYFLYPQINWNAKSESIRQICSSLNIGMNTFAFIDDQPFERMEVEQALPEVYCIDAALYDGITGNQRFIPERITEDSRMRRVMYQQDIARSAEEEKYPKNNVGFLRSLGMELLITAADETDLARAEELTVRTNQLNATGKIYSYSELEELMNNPDCRLLLCELKDRFGSYGKIGLILLSVNKESLHVEMMLFSCRVMSRGIGSMMLHYLHQKAVEKQLALTASFKDTGRNRMMYMTYKMAGFDDSGHTDGDCSILEYKPGISAGLPPYIEITDQSNI